jgi:hypothetical protein
MPVIPATPKEMTWWEEEGWIKEPSPELRKVVMEGLASIARGEPGTAYNSEEFKKRYGL